MYSKKTENMMEGRIDQRGICKVQSQLFENTQLEEKRETKIKRNKESLQEH